MKWPLCLDGWFAVSLSLVCGLRTIYPVLFTLHLQVSVKEKHAASQYAKIHVYIEDFPNTYISDSRRLNHHKDGRSINQFVF